MFQLSKQLTFYGSLLDLGWRLVSYIGDRGIVSFNIVKIIKQEQRKNIDPR